MPGAAATVKTQIAVHKLRALCLGNRCGTAIHPLLQSGTALGAARPEKERDHPSPSIPSATT
jgi:hypothetical protein